jgi:hypothetical protein
LSFCAEASAFSELQNPGVTAYGRPHSNQQLCILSNCFAYVLKKFAILGIRQLVWLGPRLFRCEHFLRILFVHFELFPFEHDHMIAFFFRIRKFIKFLPDLGRRLLPPCSYSTGEFGKTHCLLGYLWPFLIGRQVGLLQNMESFLAKENIVRRRWTN